MDDDEDDEALDAVLEVSGIPPTRSAHACAPGRRIVHSLLRVRAQVAGLDLLFTRAIPETKAEAEAVNML